MESVEAPNEGGPAQGPVDPSNYTDVLQQQIKRGREDEQVSFDEVDGIKKTKLETELTTINTLAMPNYAATGNIKNPVFDGVPSLTPEWLLKRVWLKVNGELNATVWAGVISKDMGSNLRKEIRQYLEAQGKVPPTGRINLKSTIMHAFEYVASVQKDTPMFNLIRDASRDMNKASKKEGKKEKEYVSDFMVALTPYGQSVCINELKQRKRDRFTQRGSDLHKESQVLPSILTVVPTSPAQEVENELEKREMQLRDQSTKMEYLAAQLERKEMENAQLRAYLEQYKTVPTYSQAHDSLIQADVLAQSNQMAQLYQNSTAPVTVSVPHQM